MFLIRDKGVKALEKNLEKAREQIKILEKNNKALFLERETLRVENLHYKQEAESYKKKYESTKNKLVKQMNFNKVLKEMDDELNKTLEENRRCRKNQKTL